MKSIRRYLYFNTDERVELINITNKVREVLKESGIKERI